MPTLQADLFKPPSQQQQVYDFIKSRGGRILTHELVYLSVNNHINDPYTRARELARDGKIWRIKPFIMKVVYPHANEEAWSVWESDRM